ncbi:cytochrome P450 [Streptomyces sp. NPDC001406]|uniref:cytochrome P450 family protein n=1 Tax=Streptomyces sp. NPDC001406 TaxID=3364572 RepID=UPI0036B56F36
MQVFLERTACSTFLDAALGVYEAIRPGCPYPCFGVLVGRMHGGNARIERVEFGRNVRATDSAALGEFAECIVPCFGTAYENPHRGYWCDSTDLLRILRGAEADDLDILGSIHLHPDWHNIDSPGGGPPLSEHPTSMDTYVFINTGWPVNLICYLERRNCSMYHSWGAWTPNAADPSNLRCDALPVRLALPAHARGNGRPATARHEGLVNSEQVNNVVTHPTPPPGHGDGHNVTDLMDQQSYVDAPYELLAGWRAERPVQRVTFAGAPVWLVTRHEDIRTASKDPRLSNDPEHSNKTVRSAPWAFANETYTVTRNMLRSDPPDHTRLRALVAGEFTPGRIEALRPRIQEITDDLLAPVLPSGRLDVITDFAKRLPLTVISEVLGVPAEGRDTFARLAGVYVEMSEGDHDRMPRAACEMRDYLIGLLKEKREATVGADDLLGRLLAGDHQEDELIAMSFLLLVAGFETTANLIGNGVLALLEHPEQLAMLRAQPHVMGQAIEEILRWNGPIKMAPVLRFTTCDVQIGDVTVPGGGEAVLLSYGASNRDPARFAEPDRFDIRRDSRGHLAFGHGIHHCLGAPLGKAEATIGLRTLLERCDELALATDPGELTWGHSRFMHGLTSLPVTFRPVERGATP